LSELNNKNFDNVERYNVRKLQIMWG